MRNSIKRLYEADDVQQLPMNGQAPAPHQMPNMAPPAPVATSAEMMPDFNFQDETPSEPTQDQQALPQADVMNLTVQELMDRCDKINPLICMGLRQFIDSNKDEILNQTTGEAPESTDGHEENNDITTDDTDINFSKQMEPQAPQFTLDQQEGDLEFPQA